MKKFLLIVCIFFTATSVSFSNIKINNTHKDKEKDGKKINCSYCHSSGPKILQKKGQLKGNLLNGVALGKINGCAGKGCHK